MQENVDNGSYHYYLKAKKTSTEIWLPSSEQALFACYNFFSLCKFFVVAISISAPSALYTNK